MRAFVTAIIAVGCLTAAVAAADQGELVPLKPKQVFVPVGFDSNDEILAVVDGYLPDPCHRLRTPTVKYDASQRVYTITPMAERHTGVCQDVIVPFHQTVSLGRAKAGEYSVTVSQSELREKLTVAQARTPTVDDYLYAPVDNAAVFIARGQKPEAVIQGRFMSTCHVIEQLKSSHTGKTIQILPIMKRLERDPEGKPCEAKERAFQSSLHLDSVQAGRFLLHVRSLNGQSVNEVFTAE